MFRLSIIADRGIFTSHGAWLAALDRVARLVESMDDVSLQVRVKGLDDHTRSRLIAKASEVLGPRAARAILNGTPAEAREHGFRGAHLPEAQIEASHPDASPLLVGASVHSLAALERALAARVDYVQFGPVFDAGSKPAAGVGFEALAAIVAESPVPVVAVGGITPGNAPACLEAGAAAVAVVTGVFRQPDPGDAIATYLAACRAATSLPARA